MTITIAITKNNMSEYFAGAQWAGSCSKTQERVALVQATRPTGTQSAQPRSTLATEPCPPR